MSKPRESQYLKDRLSEGGIEGVLCGLSSLPLLGCFWSYGDGVVFGRLWIPGLAVAAALLFLLGCLLFSRWPGKGKLTVAAALFVGAAVFVPVMTMSPTVALAVLVFVAYLTYFGLVHVHPESREITTGKAEHALRRANNATTVVLPLLVTATVFQPEGSIAIPLLVNVYAFFAGALGLLWARSAFEGRHHRRALVFVALFLLVGLVVLSYSFVRIDPRWASLLWPMLVWLLLPKSRTLKAEQKTLLQVFGSHPARLLASTFLLLCAIGSVLLVLPVSSAGKSISPIDAIFTSVSAVCVTGLIVLDTPNDFSLTGQVFILILIQVGGLGIMTIASIALHTLGQRFSLQQERILVEMSGESRTRLFGSLRQVLWFSLAVESIGALTLLTQFAAQGDGLGKAAWRAVFTSVSAFCNAGFALQSDNLVGYQTHPLILHIIAILIVLGGISPAVAAMIPKIVAGRPTPPQALIVLVTTLALLVVGTIFFAATEWQATLSGLPYLDRLHNAWFQSATLRTAGFNSVDISAVTPTTYVLMIILMFIGGSPGGTAGGIKTTTLAVIVLCMNAGIRGRSEVVLKRRTIGPGVVYRAVAVIGTGFLALLATVIMLELTQHVSSHDLIFEAVSALGTVGLSTGATAKLDSIGKVVIMLAMFLGRIGPLTMFMLLSNPFTQDRVSYPAMKISLS